jgi:hypothetical protein
MRLVLRLMLASALVLGLGLLGCDSATDGDGGGDGDGDGGGHGLGWAMDIADPIQDTELPDGSLVWICNNNITDTGEIDQSGAWLFIYTVLDVSAAERFLGVAVCYDGTTVVLDEDDLEDEGYYPEEFEGLEAIPSYRDAEPWVTAADGALDDYGDLYWTLRILNVFSDLEGFPDAGNIAYFIYVDTDNSRTVAHVWLDADTNEVLDVIVL